MSSFSYKKSIMANKENKEKEIALELFHNMRGKYIIGQALYYAEKYLMDMPVEKREVSNADDMKLLGENLFALGYLPTKMLQEESTKIKA